MQKTLFKVNGCPQIDRLETEWYGVGADFHLDV